MNYIQIALGIILFILGYEDIRTKKVSVWICILGGLIIAIGIIFLPEKNIMDRLIGGMVGGIMMGVSKLTQGKIGMGDGMILVITGFALGFWANMELFAISLFFAAIVSIILLVFRKVSRKQAIPFVPFLCLGYGAILYMNYMI